MSSSDQPLNETNSCAWYFRNTALICPTCRRVLSSAVWNTLIYLKVVEAARPPVEEVLSRALTLAVRLLGVEGSVYFEFMPVNLRPEEELEAYKGTKQNRVLELLSHGLINDADACYQLGMRPQGIFGLLQGTGFYGKAAAQPAADRSTSAGAALAPDTPTKSGGKDQ